MLSKEYIFYRRDLRITQSIASGGDSMAVVEPCSKGRQVPVFYMCSGWFFKQLINSSTGSSPLHILWTAVNIGNLEKSNRTKYDS